MRLIGLLVRNLLRTNFLWYQSDISSVNGFVHDAIQKKKIMEQNHNIRFENVLVFF